MHVTDCLASRDRTSHVTPKQEVLQSYNLIELLPRLSVVLASRPELGSRKARRLPSCRQLRGHQAPCSVGIFYKAVSIQPLTLSHTEGQIEWGQSPRTADQGLLPYSVNTVPLCKHSMDNLQHLPSNITHLFFSTLLHVSALTAGHHQALCTSYNITN